MENKVRNLAQKELQDFEMPKSNREAEPVNREILKELEYNLEELILLQISFLLLKTREKYMRRFYLMFTMPVDEYVS